LTENELTRSDPQKYIALMSITAPTDVNWLTEDDVEGWAETPSIGQWIAATCGAMTKEEDQQVRRTPSDQDQVLLQSVLLSKAEHIQQCGEGKKARFRDSMNSEATPAVAT
jgi:hypothetical protein